MSDIHAPRASHLRLVPPCEPAEEDILSLVGDLGPSGRRILAAVIAKVRDADDDASEEAACAVIDRVISVLQRR